MFKLSIKTPERHQCRRSGIFNVNFENILHLVLVHLVNFEHVNADLEEKEKAKNIAIRNYKQEK